MFRLWQKALKKMSTMGWSLKKNGPGKEASLHSPFPTNQWGPLSPPPPGLPHPDSLLHSLPRSGSWQFSSFFLSLSHASPLVYPTYLYLSSLPSLCYSSLTFLSPTPLMSTIGMEEATDKRERVFCFPPTKTLPSTDSHGSPNIIWNKGLYLSTLSTCFPAIETSTSFKDT